MKVVNKIEKLQGQLTVLEKAFLWFFYFKNSSSKKKMAQFQPRLLTILDKIEKVHDHINVIVDTEDFSINEKLF